MTQPLDSYEQDAYDVLVRMLREWGLESLAPDVLRFLQEGKTQDQIGVLLQDTESYKKRFAGNEERRKKGLPVLNPREYLEVEASYRQIMESAGLPPGFYDDPSDYSSWIGSDVSPTEVKSRVDIAVGAAERLDDGTLRAFNEYYGIGANDLAAFFLDRERALPQLQRIARGVRIGGAAFGEGLNVTRERAEQLATSDLGDSQIRSAIGRVKAFTRDIGKLGSLYGDDYTQADAEDETFFDSEQARKKRANLSSRERSTFGGNSGVGGGSLSRPSGSY